MTVNVVPWNGPEIISCFTITRRWVLWWRPVWFSSKIFPLFSLFRAVPYHGGCSQNLISSRQFHFSMLAWISDASIFSKSSMSATKMSPLQILHAYKTEPRNIPGETFLPNWWSLDRSLADTGSSSIIERNGIIGPLNGLPNRRSWGVLPIKQEILNVSKIAVALHGIRPPFLIQTWLQQYSRSSLFNPAYRSLSNPNCFWTMKRWRTMIPGKIFTCFPKFHRVVSVNGFWFPRRLQELLEALFCFQRSFCFARIWLNPLSCHILYHDWHIGDCLQIPSSRTVIWRYQVTKLFCTRYRCASAFSARSPCYLGLHADVAVSVLREVRKKLGLPDTTFPRGSET